MEEYQTGINLNLLKFIMLSQVVRVGDMGMPRVFIIEMGLELMPEKTTQIIIGVK